MKPNELIEDLDNFYGTSRKNLYPYLEKDCVIAYDKNKLGNIFIIKSKTKHFAFFCITNMLRWEMISGICGRRIDLDTAVKLLGDCNILDKEEYEKVKREIILENL